ncbi:MAG: protein-glutamate O-methyltransferase CheR [Deltaproteobacteria bacterium]|nr:protein-glutamate O-methyltransferase CheR [Deltaproteobacteria bacterium]
MTTSSDSFRYITTLLHRRAAIVIEPGKEYLVESRLAPLAKRHGFVSIDALTEAVKRDERGAVASELIEALTTNETSFFRDIHPFEALKTKVLPDVIAARCATKSLRIWCAAASTGQEIYTIAMVIKENFPELDSWNVQIVGTDLNTAVLARARGGLYRQLEVNRGLPAPMLVKYFEREGMDWRVKPALKKLVTFQELNLLERWPIFSPPDIVFMRNVLIYFDVATKKEILTRVRKTMRADGYLFLGGAETTMNVDDEYGPVRVGTNTVVFRAKTTIAAEALRASA